MRLRKWLCDYDIPGADGLGLRHLYRTMAWHRQGPDRGGAVARQRGENLNGTSYQGTAASGLHRPADAARLRVEAVILPCEKVDLR